ncbi:MAG TPA: hypothetical protein VJY54_13110 [Lachnospiraceae bacterium]|nr:hypothetical protein [Lachnospiraceae bacterium]
MKQQLKTKEYEVLQILLKSDVPMTASELVKTDKRFTVNIVQAILRKLLAMKLIEVADIVYSRNVLSRAYLPAKNASEIIQELFSEDVKQFQKLISKKSLLSALLDLGSDSEYSEKEIEILEKYIQDTKNKR